MKTNLFKRVTRYCGYILLVAVLFVSCDYPYITTKNKIQELCENCYFEGQKDYSNGDKRIEFTKDSCWVWVKSPWDDGEQPIFNPSIIHSRNGD